MEFLALPPVVSVRKTRGEGKFGKIPDFGPFALEIWPKNTTKFPAAFGGQLRGRAGYRGELKELE